MGDVVVPGVAVVVVVAAGWVDVGASAIGKAPVVVVGTAAVPPRDAAQARPATPNPTSAPIPARKARLLIGCDMTRVSHDGFCWPAGP